MKGISIFILMSVLVFFTACDFSAYNEEDEHTLPEQPAAEEKTVLFEEDEQKSCYVFETNDTDYLTANGYTLWSLPYVNTEDDFVPYTVRATKQSGRSEAGFGIVFCEQEIDEKPFMLTVLINSNGLYAIGKIADGVFYHINDGWKKSDYIYSGSGVSNSISVMFDSESKAFILRINNYDITTFTISENISFKNSRAGFAVVIAGNEDFPNNPVKVTFER